LTHFVSAFDVSRWIQNPVFARMCGFDPRPRYNGGLSKGNDPDLNHLTPTKMGVGIGQVDTKMTRNCHEMFTTRFHFLG